MLESIVRQDALPEVAPVASPRWQRYWPILALVLLAFFFRVHDLVTIPGGLHHDEAYNGLDALRVLHGAHPLFFPANFGREPFFLYLLSLFVGLFGRTAFAIRLAAVFVGTATIPASYLLSRQLFGKPVALLATFWLATSFWHVNFSRIGFRSISLELLETLCFYFLWRGLQYRRSSDFAWSGALLGGVAYTYLSSRFLPLLLLLFFAAFFVLHPRLLSSLVKPLLLLVGIATLVFAPLGGYFFIHRADFIQRLDAVSLLNPEISQGKVPGAILKSFWQTIAMFSIHGDESWRHNIAGRPLFGWPMAALFYAGLLLSLWRIRRPPYLFVLSWLLVMLFPSVLSTESPNYLRLLSLSPVVFIFPALGVVALGQWIRVGIFPSLLKGLRPGEHSPARWARSLQTVLAALLLWSAADSYHQYFGIWAKEPSVYYIFDSQTVAIGTYLEHLPGFHGQVLLSSAENYPPTISFLSTHPRPAKIFDGQHAVVFPTLNPGDEALYLFPALRVPVQADVLPYFNAAYRLPVGARDPAGHPAFYAYRVPAEALPSRLGLHPPNPQSTPLGPLTILGYHLDGPLVPGQTGSVTIYWRVNKSPRVPYSIYVHLLGVGNLTLDLPQYGNNDFPGWQWNDGDYVIGHYPVQPRPDAPPGPATLQFVLFPLGNAPTYQAPIAAAPIAPTVLPYASIAPFIQHPLQQSTGALTLRGYTLSDSALDPGQVLTASLYWQANGRPVQQNLLPRLSLVDTSGKTITSQSQPFTMAPATWAPGQILRGDLELPIPANLLAGTYRLQVQGELSPCSSASRCSTPPIALGSLSIRAVAHLFTVPPLAQATSLDFGNSITLLGYTLSSDHVSAGQPLTVQLIWRTGRTPQHRYVAFVHLLDHTYTLQAQQDNEPVAGRRPTTGWLPGEVVPDGYELTIPAEASPGRYLLEVGLYDRETGDHLPVQAQGIAPPGQSAILTPIVVKPATPPTLSELQPVQANFANLIFLRGYKVRPGKGSLDVDLGWQAQAAPGKDYTVFVHLLAPDGRLVAQNDSQPGQGSYPTSVWERGDTISDRHHLQFPAPLAPGPYQLEIGLYDAATGQRLALVPENGQAATTRILVGPVIL